MAVEEKDIQEVATALQKNFDEFKVKNDARFTAIEAEKGKLAGEVETLNGKLTELDALKTELENELKSAKRPGGGTRVGTKAAKEHSAAFEGFVRKGKDDGLADLERKAMETDSDPDGGYAVPEELDRNIIKILANDVVMRSVSTVIAVGSPAYKRLVDLGGISSGWVGETDARPATDTPKLTEVTPFWGELYGNPQATQTMLDDAFFNVENFLMTDLAEEFAEKEEVAFTNGDGTKKPKGYLAYPQNAVDDKTRAFGTLQTSSPLGATLVGDDLIKLLYTLRKKYRQGASWMLNNNSLFTVRTLKDSEGNYLWRPGIEMGQPSSLLGYGIAENEEMPDIGSATTPISFGNFKRGYYILDRMGTRMLRDPYTNKPYVGFYTTKRVGGMLVDSCAIKVLKMNATAPTEKK
ncbi:phage major capsid protein [Rahnella aceris]|uniref:phage major capsid protein n=1 Tax=Rahnella sp. (strain Y9602) TaxID=2703885 RepID=UPI001C267FF4|nr:phage major capsid protein [Rahnella aceris]MBU9866811.1 phage major capsid protein [Rahnella aceris]